MDNRARPKSLLFAEAVPLFRHLNASGAILDEKTRKPRVRSENRVRQVISAVRSTIEARFGGDPDTFDLCPYRNTLVMIAREVAKHDRHSNPSNKAGDVKTFLVAVLGIGNGPSSRRARREISLAQVPTSWQALFAPYCKRVNGKLVGSPAYRRHMLSFIDAMVVNGVSSPDELPLEREAILELLTKADVPPHEHGRVLTAYRHVLDLLDLPLPRYQARSPFERGLRTVPNLRDLCEEGLERRLEEEPEWVPPLLEGFEQWHIRDILHCVAPEVSGDLEEYLSWAEDNGGRSSGQNDMAMDAVAALVTELLRMGLREEAWQLNTFQLFQVFQLSVGMKAVNPRVRKRAHANGMQAMSLARIALDAAALRSLENTVLDVHSTLANAPVSYYTDAIRNEFSALLSLIKYVHGTVSAARSEQPIEWDFYTKEVETIQGVVKAVNGSAATDGHRDVSLFPLTWPQALFVGVKKLRDEVKRAQVEFWDARDTRESEQGRTVSKYYRAYSALIRLYVIAVLFLSDAMRGRNYGYGRLNVNFLPEWEFRDGNPYRITAMRVVFSGADTIARPKKSTTTGRDGSRKIHTREVRLNSALVDLDLVSDYILEVRPRDLVRAGAIPDLKSYDPLTDEHAFIVNPQRPRAAKTGRRRARGSNRSRASYSLPWLSKLFGLWLLEVARDLKLVDTHGDPLPTVRQLKAQTSAGKKLRKRWRGLLNGHIVRHLVTSYVGGWCKLWDIVTALTDDTKRTLEDHYLQNYAAYYESLRFKTGIHHPDHFKALTLAVFKEPVFLDWDALDPERPMEALTWAGEAPGQSQMV